MLPMLKKRKRIMIKKPGTYNALTFDETPLGAPGPGEVQVDIKACGINFADISVRLGLYAAAKNAYPLCPGLEFSGYVRRTGQGVEDFKFGDRVFGATRFGGYATAINCPADQLWHLPETWDLHRGAAFPVSYLTAYYGLHQVGHLKRSSRVLIHSAAGGVGTSLLHLVRAFMAEKISPLEQKAEGQPIVGVVGNPEKIPHILTAGATHAIDKSAENLWQKASQYSPNGFDLIFDANGASTLKESYKHIKPTGRLIIYGFASMLSHSGSINRLKLLWDYLRTPRFSPFDLTGANKSVCGFNLIYLFEKASFFRSIMTGLLSLNSRGMLPKMPLTVFPFENVADAHRAMESGKTIGKLVLKI